MDENTSKVFDDALADSLLGMGSPSGESGSTLFVINLCASQAPYPTSSKTLPGLDNYRLYQVARREDGRTRHRLRLGFFTSEADAESVLASVRQQYPTAFTTCLCEEDKRFARGYVPTASAPPKISIVPTPAALAQTSAPVAKPKLAPSAAPKSAAQMPAAPMPAAPKIEVKPVAAPAVAAASSRIEVKASTPKEPAPASKAATAHKIDVAPKSNHTSKSESAKPGAVELGFLEDLTWEPPPLTPAANAAVHTESVPAKPGAKKPTVEVKTDSPAAKAPAKAPNAKAAGPVAKVVDTSASMRVRALELTFSDPPAPVAKTTATGDNKPFHVGKGIELPSNVSELQLEAAPTAALAAAATKASPSKPVPSLKQPPAPASAPVRPMSQPAVKAAPAVPAVVHQPATNSDLDSTQTIRALTSDEMNDAAQEKWFAIQLAASEQPVNLDAMPHLDIFEAYTLYSVAIAGSGKIVHSLRLGFFKEAVSAEAVSGYLKTFFNSPSVLRISVAEHARFKDSPPPQRGVAASAKPDSKVVELNNARAAKPAIPTVTMEVVPSRHSTSATGSFKLNQTGSFDTSATGSFRTSASGSHRALTPTLKPAAKAARPAVKRSEPLSKHSTTGKYKAAPKKSLSEQLLDEARGVNLSESAIRKLPKNDSLLSRFVDKLKS